MFPPKMAENSCNNVKALHILLFQAIGILIYADLEITFLI